MVATCLLSGKISLIFVPARAVLDHRFTKAFSQKNKASLNLYFPEKAGTLLQVFGSSFDDELRQIFACFAGTGQSFAQNIQ